MGAPRTISAWSGPGLWRNSQRVVAGASSVAVLRSHAPVPGSGMVLQRRRQVNSAVAAMATTT
jgi:hypothetical protein